MSIRKEVIDNLNLYKKNHPKTKLLLMALPHTKSLEFQLQIDSGVLYFVL